MEFSLDHISLQISHVGKHKAFIENDLGFILNLTPQLPDHHGYILLDRTGIEVSSSTETTTHHPGFPTSAEFFLRTDNFNALCHERQTRQLPLKAPEEYIATDGSVWYDLEFDMPELIDLLPMITQLIQPEEKVKKHPSPLIEEHPNALRTLSAVYLMTNRYDDLVRVFSDFLDQPKPTWQENHFFGTEQRTFHLSNGEIVICKPARSILKQTYLGSEGEGIFGLFLQSGNRQRTDRFYSESRFDIIKDELGMHWLRPNADLKFFLGY